MIIENKIHYNNKKYGRGKAYVAKVNGLNEKYGLEREFLNRYTEYINSSSTTWYKYSWNLKESGIYEIQEANNFKFIREYIRFNADEDEEKKISFDEVLEFFGNENKSAVDF